MIKLCGCKLAKSIPGLRSGAGLCQDHYNMFMFGDDKARQIASAYKQAVYCTREQWAQEKLLNKNIK